MMYACTSSLGSGFLMYSLHCQLKFVFSLLESVLLVLSAIPIAYIDT